MILYPKVSFALVLLPLLVFTPRLHGAVHPAKKPAATKHAAAAPSHGAKGTKPGGKTAAVAQGKAKLGNAKAGKAGLGKGKGKASQGKEKPARIPRTLRTVPVSPQVRESAVDLVQRALVTTAILPFTYPEALRPFFRALAAEQAERAAAPYGASVGTTTGFSHSVRVLQYGDSHTAADIFTGEMRSRFQEQFGDGGLGFQFPGHPFAGYRLNGSTRTQTPGWVTEGNRFTALGDGDLGLGGLSIATTLAGQTTLLHTTCDSLQLHYLRQPGGGRLQFSDNGTPISVIETAGDTASNPTSRAGTFSYACAAGPHDLEFTTLDHAPVKLLGIVTEQPGVTWECLGINGAVAPLMLRWNQALFTEYLRQREPNLIVLAYGTNEAGSSAEHLESYPADLAQMLDILHRTAPEASVMILGPADRAMSTGRGRRASWHPLTGTSRIIAMQREACATHGCTFWDTRQRMGGLGSMAQWVAAGWAQPDRTHLTATGYRALADALYADLVHAYNVYQQHPEAATQP